EGGGEQVRAARAGTARGGRAAVGGVVFGARNRAGVRSEGEPLLSGVTVRLVNETGSVVAVTKTGPEGEYLFERVPAGQYRVEAERWPEWAGAVSSAFTGHPGTVRVDPLGKPPVAAAVAVGAAP